MAISKPSPETVTAITPKIELVAGCAKSLIYRIDEVRQEIINAVQAMKAGYLTPQQAIDWIEEVAPGWLGYIPPLTGLGVKRDGGTE
jgi:hypothetical protein